MNKVGKRKYEVGISKPDLYRTNKGHDLNSHLTTSILHSGP
jgi:hypothetical protein